MSATSHIHSAQLAANSPHLAFRSHFIKWWISLFSHSPKAELLWRGKTGPSVQDYSATRWWSKWEVTKQLMEMFVDVTPFLDTNANLAPATQAKLLSILKDPQKLPVLQVDLEVIADAGTPFVRGTYNLEGYGPLVLKCYEEINCLNAAVSQAHYPSLQAVINHIHVHICKRSTHTETMVKIWNNMCSIRPNLLHSTT